MLDTAGQLPSWLTKDYLQDKLRIYYKDNDLQLLELSSNAASGKGQNWIGIMTRIYVKIALGNGKLEDHSYIVKESIPGDSLESKVFKEYALYTREMYMYETVLPAMSEVLREVGIEGKLHANAVHIDYVHTVMILEDLVELKYYDPNRLEGLDLSHVQLVLDILAKYHAAGAILGQRKPEIFSKHFESTFFTRGYDGFKRVHENMFKALMRYVKTQPKLESRYYAKMEKVLPNVMEYSARCFDIEEQDFQALSHGDCWTTNVMFRYNKSGKPVDVIPIDFQYCSWSSPIVDLHYFLCTSPGAGLENRQLEFTQYYYYSLKNALKQLNYRGRIPTLHEFQLEFKQRGFMALMSSLISQPIQRYNGNEDASFINLYSDNKEALRFQDSIYEDPKIQRNIELLLPIFDAEGILDNMD